MEKYVQAGLDALANAVVVDPEGWFQGHVGASFLAGAFLLHDQALSDDAKRALIARLDLQIEKYQAFLSPSASYGERGDDSVILDAMNQVAGQLSRSGHGIIYGAILLDTLKQFDIQLSSQSLENIAKLILNCAHDQWSRYVGIDDYRTYESSLNVPDTLQELLLFALTNSTSQVYLNDHSGHFFTGEKVHGVTHAHAIYVLEMLGYHEISKKSSQQLMKQIELNRQRPQGSACLAQPKRFDLTDPKIWLSGFHDEHQIKLAYSYHQLSGFLREQTPSIDMLWGAINAGE